jgi:hypothetical protein
VTYDPLSKIEDDPLHIDAGILQELVSFRSQPKLLNLPGTDTVLERERLSKVANGVADALIRDVEANPSKRWVMGQFQVYLEMLGAAAKRPLNAHVLDGPCGLLAIAVSFAAGFVKSRALYKVRHI